MPVVPETYFRPFRSSAAWAATDRKGQVAVFTTEVSGAIPRVLLDGHDGFIEDLQVQGLALALQRQGATAEPILSLSNHYAPDEPSPKGVARALSSSGCAVFFSQREAAEALRQTMGGSLTLAEEGWALVFADLTSDQARELRRHPKLLGAVSLPLRRESAMHPLELASHGVYLFRHVLDGVESGPYGRIARPRKPIDLDSIPNDLRTSVEQIRFDDLEFDSNGYLQPCEHVSCIVPHAECLLEDFETECVLARDP